MKTIIRFFSCLLLVSVMSNNILADTLAANDTLTVSNLREDLHPSHYVDSADVADIDKYKFRPTQLILPGALIAVGAFGVKNGAFRKLDNTIMDGLNSLSKGRDFEIDDYIQYLPVVAYAGLGAVGVKCKHNFRERFAAGIISYIAMGLMVNTLKQSVDEKRPHSNANNSFPSGHTSKVFTSAELIRLEYGTGIAIGGYTVAAGVAFLRLYNGRHWFNDVIAGAGIGILSARIGYWMLPLCQKWLNWGNKKTIAMLPAYDFNNRVISVGMVASF